MSPMSPTHLQDDDKTTAQMVERIAAETATLANRHAWQEILVRIRLTGRSERRLSELRGLVWAARKRNAALNRAANIGGSR
jgi:hypothetical protein